MGNTFGFNLNNREIVEVCDKWDIREEKIGQTFKQIALDPDKLSKFVKVLKGVTKGLGKNEKFDVDQMPIAQVKEKVSDLDIKALKAELGIGKSNKSNKISAKGLYFNENLERYCSTFFQHWSGDFDKIPELLAQIGLMTKEEVIAKEYAKRLSNG